MELELKSHQANLESEVQARTKQLEEALLIKSRFMAIMSHGAQETQKKTHPN